MRTPVNMKRGTASRKNESQPAYILWTTIIREKSPCIRRAVMAATPIATAMGAFRARRMRSVRRRVPVVVTSRFPQGIEKKV
jgi:hypothetical protein